MAVRAASRGRSRTGSALLLLAAVAAVAAPPLLLARLVGNPLPTLPIDLGAAVEAVRSGLVPASVWVDVLAVVTWIVWAVLVVVLALEIVAVVADRPSTAAAPAWVRQLAQVLVTAVLTLSAPTHTAMTGVSAVAPAVAVAIDTAPSMGDAGVSVSSGEAAPPGTRLVTVVDGDSWNGFAEAVIGDSTAGNRLRELNAGRRVHGQSVSADTAFVEPGWQLLVPTATRLDDRPAAARLSTAASVEHDQASAGPARQDRDPGCGPTTQSDDANVDGGGGEGVWTVERGDHMWAIAEQTLQQAWGREVSDEEIAPYWRSVIDANSDNLLPPGHPDLIYPGQVLDVPPVGRDPTVADTDADRPATRQVEKAPPASQPKTSGPQDRTEPSPATPATGAEATGEDDGDPQPRQHLGALDVDTPTKATPTQPPGPPRSEVAAPTEPAFDTMAADPAAPGALPSASSAERTVWGSPSGLAAPAAAATFLASGVAVLLRRRRRAAARQRPVGLRLPTPAPEPADELDRQMASAADPETLDTLAVLLETVPAADAPPLVTAADDGTVQLLWDDGRVPESLPAPWQPLEGVDRQAGWRARLGDQGLPVSIGIPLLATMGRTDAGLTLLANIGAMEQLTVAGQPDEVRSRLRAAALEVATSNLAGIVEVAVAGDVLPDIDDLTTVETLDTVVEDVTAELDSGVVAADRIPRLLVAHDPDTTVELPPDPHGLTGLLAAGAPDGGWSLRVDGGEATLVLPDGAQLKLVLPDVDPQLVVDELDRLDADFVPAATPVAEPDQHPAMARRANGDLAGLVEATSDGHDADGEVVVSMPMAPDPAWCEVQLLGPVRAIVDGSQVSLSPQSSQLLVCLATAPDGLTVAQLEDRIWAGRAAASGSRRVRQALHRLRGQLGDDPDGHPLLPRRTHGSTSRVRLSEHVGTDWDRAATHLQAARDAPPAAAVRQLTAALELIRGPVLDGFTVDWGTRLEQEILAALQDAAVEAAATLRHDDNLDRADWAVRQGLTLAVYEPLYVEWAQIEKARGRLDRVPRIFKHLESSLSADAGDTGLPIGPTKATQLAFHDLVETTMTVDADR